MDLEADNERLESWNEKRVKVLGWKPQSEQFHNFYLPYYNEKSFDEESNRILQQIKQNLGLAVATREIYPASGVYITKLMSYLKLYGFKFTKEEHVEFIKLIYEMIQIPNIDPAKLNKCCVCLSQLLRKSKLLSPDDLQLEWRPLYRLVKIYLDKRSTKGDLIRFYPTLEQNIHFLIQLSVQYIPLESNQEILNELLPQMQPLDIGKNDSVMEMLSLFLNPLSYELWFDYFMNLWNTYQYPCWNSDIMNLIACTSAQTIGLIDWTPHIPIMFTRILRSLELPVSYKQIKSAKNQSLSADASATWIISLIGPKYDTMKYLKNLFSTIESYLNPANSGKWVRMISDLLVQLVKYFQERLITERYKKHPWKRAIPAEYCLRDCDIQEFVEVFKPIAMTAIYSKMQPYDIGKICKGLAELRPDLILPDILEKVSLTAELINEPHKFTSALSCLSSVASVVLREDNIPDSKDQIIPIMFSVLPGIDSNDFKKTSITLQFLITVSIMIPFVDCSQASSYHKLTEEQLIICEQTSQLEDFVLQFLDRIFTLIESSSVESIRMEHNNLDHLKSKLESIAEALVQSAAHSILGQCSQEILDSASFKLVNYIKNTALEPTVAGNAMSTLCRVFARVNGKNIYHSLIPFIVQLIDSHFDEGEDVYEIEKQNDDFLYYIQILCSLVRGDPTEIQLYSDEIISVIDKLLRCKCKASSCCGANMIGNFLTILNTVQTNDIKTVPYAYEKPLKDFLPIKYWGRKMNREEKFNFFMPGERERALCEKIIHYYLLPILFKFETYIAGNLIISRDEMLLNLHIVSSVLKCNNFLENWDEEPMHLIDTIIDLSPMKLNIGFTGLEVKMPDGSNVRKTIVDLLDKLQVKLLVESSDDIKSFKQLISLWEKVHHRINYSQSFDNQLKNYQASKQFQDYKLCKTRKDIRAVVATRVIIQQDLRDELSSPCFTVTHYKILLNLIKLSTSHYSAIRSTAQSRLFRMLNIYCFSYRSIVDTMIEYLKLDPNENHESFKGALYVIGTNRRNRLMLKHDWEVVEKLWMAFLKTKLSEKLSVVRLMESITEGVNNEFQTIAVDIEVSDKIVDLGVKMMVDKTKLPQNYLEHGALKLAAKNEENRIIYHRLTDEILKYSQEKTLHWRYNLLCSTLINDLMHPTAYYSPFVAEIFVRNLIHDSAFERSIALKICNTIMKQQKREHIKITINPYKFNSASTILPPGLREDNKWLQYDIDKVPKNQQEWDEPRYAYKVNGFFGWTPKVEIYAPSSMQPNLDRSYEMLNEHEKIFYNFFSNTQNVDKLFNYWSMEEKKGKEKFQRARFWLIKQIFDTFGDIFLDNILVHVKPLIKTKNESSHRCAAEIIAGILRGAKHWNYEKTKKMYEKIMPLVRLALDNITSESDTIWGCAFATASEGIDPNKQFFLHETLLENPIRDEKSFFDCSRLYCLQGAFNQHAWRMVSVARRLLTYLTPFLDHPFQNVRERIGSTLINIFENDLNFGDELPACLPQIRHLLEMKKNELTLLKTDENQNHVIETKTPYASAIRLFKTIAQCIIGIVNRCSNGNEVIYYELISIGVRLEKCEYDVELADSCSVLLALISQAFTKPQCVNELMKKIDEVSYYTSWSARLSIIDMMQVLVFNNMPILISRTEWVDKVQEIVLRLLEDSICEVREKSAQVLGGLIHCSFLPSTDKLLELFKKKCQTKVIKRTHTEKNISVEQNIRIRHGGVLGLCAFITAYPYDIPHFTPNIFEVLYHHLDDPQPIPATIRKTLADFKRTHHDGWDFHQLKFTETQLAVLSDLTVPPSYFN
ncbi:hypothetical protein PVAND_002412 [Polypedilum vanderplanki]|uniref:Proteasome activator complex subunit 4 n=1 Tax=Polypedilum vanderplanki TaxID=319348 RepID=A0A9J6BQW8_POLVA|nr:hypothetical protein PVAND_002412 [Polypedilum vanderplanki]